jgi:ATP synthase subunit 6
MNLIAPHFNRIFSPLEQFDVVTVIINELFIDSVENLQLGVFELPYNAWSTLTNFISGNGFVGLSNSRHFLVTPFIVYIIYAVYQYAREDFSFFFFGIFFHLLTAGIVFAWFADTIIPVFNHNIFSDIQTQRLLSVSPIANLPTAFFFGQTDFALAWDENFISFLAAFFLFSGAEEEEDEDFILEEEEADFVDEIVASLFVANLGKDVEGNGPLFLKVCAAFSFVLTNNLMGMLPYSDTGTSSLILTFWVALSVFVSLLTLMFTKNGVTHLFGLFLPAGCPLPLMFLLVPIEFISYRFRLVSLAVRLFANMMAGHTLLKVIVGFGWKMFLIGDVYILISFVPVALLFILTFLELAVAFIQAYVFTILICMYLKDIYVGH